MRERSSTTGLATALNVAANGVNVDFAPVPDVDHGGFISSRSSARTPAASAGSASRSRKASPQGGVAATVKHFPGLGYAPTTTDGGPVTVHATAAELDADLAPFRAAIAAHVPLVMVSTAIYPALGNTVLAATSRVIVGGLLRRRLGYKGAVITDSLHTPGVSPFYDPGQAAVRAVAAGADLVLEPGAARKDPLVDSDSAYQALLATARSGEISKARAQAAIQLRALRPESLTRLRISDKTAWRWPVRVHAATGYAKVVLR